MVYTIEIDFSLGDGWEDISDYVDKNSITLKRILHKADMKPTVDKLSLTIEKGPEINSIVNRLLVLEEEPIVRVQRDGQPFFYGFIKRDYQASFKVRFEKIEVEVYDTMNELKVPINDIFAWNNYQICSTIDVEHSILHQMIYHLGLSSFYTSALTDIPVGIDWFYNSNRDNEYFNILEDLLYEHGYVLYCDKEGKFALHKWDIETPSATDTLDETKLKQPLIVDRKGQQYKGVEVKWQKHKTLENVVVFEDTQGSNENRDAHIEVAPLDYHPVGAGDGTVDSDYSVDDYELVIVKDGLQKDVIVDDAINVGDITNKYTKFELAFYNTANEIKYIDRYKVRGNAIVKGDLNFTFGGDVTTAHEINKIDTQYIHDKDRAEDLATALASYYEYGGIMYNGRSYEQIDVGTIVQLRARVGNYNIGYDESLTPIDNLAKIVEAKYNEKSQLFNYTLVSMSDYRASTTNTISETSPSGLRNKIITETQKQTSLTRKIQEYYGKGPGVLIPLFVYPTNGMDTLEYGQLKSLKEKYYNVPMYVILDTGSSYDSMYDGTITRLRAKGIKSLAYIDSNNESKDLTTIIDEIKSKKSYDIEGVYIDNVTNTTFNQTISDYYSTIKDYCYDMNLYPLVLNMKSMPEEWVFESEIGDVVVIDESETPLTTTDLTEGNIATKYNGKTKAAFLKNQPLFSSTIFSRYKNNLGLMYITDFTDYTQLSSYIEDMLKKSDPSANAVSYEEYMNGFEEEGGTKSPDAPSIRLIEGHFKSIVIEWDKQQNLTNLYAYEIQVADNSGGPWYEPTGGVDWKGDLDGKAQVDGTMYVHTNIPFDNGLGRELWYRVRRVTKEPLYSDWSIPNYATTSTVDNGDIAADAVRATHIKAGEIDASHISVGAVNDEHVTSISGGKISTGVLQSTNWDGIDGSFFDLNEGDLILGDKFLYNNETKTLNVNGTLTGSGPDGSYSLNGSTGKAVLQDADVSGVITATSGVFVDGQFQNCSFDGDIDSGPLELSIENPGVENRTFSSSDTERTLYEWLYNAGVVYKVELSDGHYGATDIRWVDTGTSQNYTTSSDFPDDYDRYTYNHHYVYIYDTSNVHIKTYDWVSRTQDHYHWYSTNNNGTISWHLDHQYTTTDNNYNNSTLGTEIYFQFNAQAYTMRLNNLPGTANGLSSGEVWRDGDGFLRVV